jgi:hypothetical protein
MVANDNINCDSREGYDASNVQHGSNCIAR